MKVYTRIVIDMGTGQTIEEESFQYSGPVLECKSKSSPSTVTQVQKADPWVQQQPYLLDIFGQAKNQFDYDKPDYFPGSTVVPFAPESEQALSLMADRATSGSPIISAGQQQLTDTLQGDYLNSTPGAGLLSDTIAGNYLNANPYIDDAIDRAQQSVRAGIDSQFEGAGRFGSGLHKLGLAEQYGDIASDMYSRNFAQERQNQLAAANLLGQQYGNERQRQMQSMLFAPQFANQDYYDLDRLAAVGGAREGMDQSLLSDEVARHNFEQTRDMDALARYMQLVQGNYGGSSTGTTTTPQYSSPVSGILGGALAAGGLAQMGGLFGSAATATAPAIAASPWAWPAVGLGALAGGLL